MLEYDLSQIVVIIYISYDVLMIDCRCIIVILDCIYVKNIENMLC